MPSKYRYIASTEPTPGEPVAAGICRIRVTITVLTGNEMDLYGSPSGHTGTNNIHFPTGLYQRD